MMRYDKMTSRSEASPELDGCFDSFVAFFEAKNGKGNPNSLDKNRKKNLREMVALVLQYLGPCGSLKEMLQTISVMEA
ncbi:hypothetical protein GN958_ATG05585 [Phytophthora infestans]|uniref:Uncharacterized protein n=1 Tax=Phytophthora infestans TaxID=4787 RepID=A0A8S9UX56_PHYIN|nr:hypothetical protein GN958_ATG05585 [Phytophthora infestans]